MIKIVQGNMFTTSLQTIMCTTNTIGAMGRGNALYVKKKYPEVFSHYRSLYKNGELDIHTLHISPTRDKKQILLFPTKKEWYYDSHPDWIAYNLRTLSTQYEALGIKSLAMPLPGVGNGNVCVHLSHFLVEAYLSELPIPIELYMR